MSKTSSVVPFSLKLDSQPVFPSQIIRGVAKEFVNTYKPTTECPEEFLWSSFATLFGLIVSPYVVWDGPFKEQPRLITFNIGSSAVTRKSTGATLAMELVRPTEDESDSIRMIQGFGSVEGFLRLLEGNGNGTPPTLLYLDELDLFMKRSSMSGSLGTAPFHQLIEKNNFDYPRVDGTIEIRDAYMAILANATTDRFKALWSDETVDSGFLNRAMLITGNPTQRLPNPPQPDSTRVNRLREQIAGVLEVIQTGEKIRMTFSDASACELWENYYIREINPADPAFNRIDFMGVRLMMIVALQQGETAVSREVVSDVIDFLRYQVRLRRLLHPILGNNPTARMEEKIRREIPTVGDEVSEREVKQNTNAYREGIEVFKRALNNLIQAGEVIRREKQLRRSA